MLPFLGTQLLNRAPQIETKVYVNPINTGLLAHWQSRLDNWYKRSLLTTMLDRARTKTPPILLRRSWKTLALSSQTTIQPVFVSRKIGQYLKECEIKPQLVNQQRVVYQFKCNLCDTGSYVGYTRGHLYARVDGHKSTSSSVRKHYDHEGLSLRTSLAISKFSRNAWTNSIVLSTICFTSNN